jgi:hypothetical protein
MNRIFADMLLGALLLGLLGASEYGFYRFGYNTAETAAKAREARADADALARLETAAKGAQARERALRDELDAATTKRDKENADHEKTISDLRARARAGDLRLRADLTAGSCDRNPPAAGSGLAVGPGDQARADLVPGTADALLRIAGDSARLVRDYNALVDAYNAARLTCNAAGAQ